MKPDYKTIYLVPTDVEAGQVTYSWCDCPTPGEGMREEDATRYVREDLVPASNQVLALRIAELGSWLIFQYLMATWFATHATTQAAVIQATYSLETPDLTSLIWCARGALNLGKTRLLASEM
ncbi:hypothetical protein ABC502_07690 [Alkalimonas sp. NCh-2]|uniref:hypothetical protein n=1 Tax=Alkalimonas sp. NCh-2 TaxID=3144846 RepID=UPI0031F70967